VSENRVPRRIYGRQEKESNGENYTMTNFIIGILHLILPTMLKSRIRSVGHIA
jgi:hypothetical protein